MLDARTIRKLMMEIVRGENIKEFMRDRHGFIKKLNIEIGNDDFIEIDNIYQDLMAVGEASAISNTVTNDMQCKFDLATGIARRKFLVKAASVTLSAALPIVLMKIGEKSAHAKSNYAKIDSLRSDMPCPAITGGDCDRGSPACVDTGCNNQTSCNDVDECVDNGCTNNTKTYNQCADSQCTDLSGCHNTGEGTCRDGSAAVGCSDGGCKNDSGKCTDESNCVDGNVANQTQCTNNGGCINNSPCLDAVCVNEPDDKCVTNSSC